MWLWLWHRLAAVAWIRPLAWEPTYAEGEALKSKKKKKKKKKDLAIAVAVAYRWKMWLRCGILPWL